MSLFDNCNDIDGLTAMCLDGQQKTKTCGNCVNCEKYGESWSCENYDRGVGWPHVVSPPHDEACSNWSDDPRDKDQASDALRDFVDHFWDERD